MSYYDKKDQPYKNYYTNPGSAYTDASKKQQQENVDKNKKQQQEAAVDPRITQKAQTNTGTYIPVDTRLPANNTPSVNTDNTTPTATGGSTADPNSTYFNKMMELYRQQMAEEKARQERVKQERINAANTVYNTSKKNLDAAANSSLRQAYIKHMQDQKALPQQMQAFGISGGATETNLANMKNAYGNNRTSILNEKLAQQRLIEQDRANAIANAEADAANYEASATREYNNGLINMYQSALSNVPKYNGTSSTTSQITKNPWYDVAVGYLKDGSGTDEVIATLKAQGVSDDIIDAILYNWESTI